MEPIIGEEGAQSCGRMLVVVVANLCHREEVGLVSLSVVAVDTEVLFQHRVQALRLAIRLGVKSKRTVGVDAEDLHQPVP